jgi:hypothetical protein
MPEALGSAAHQPSPPGSASPDSFQAATAVRRLRRDRARERDERAVEALLAQRSRALERIVVSRVDLEGGLRLESHLPATIVSPESPRSAAARLQHP